jgi:tetratricopeptide (TPR) repeat protein
MGVVYRARHAALGSDVALKVIASESGADPEAVERFQREARAGAGLAGHPGIVPVSDVGRDGDRWYLAMELVQGEGLEQIAADEPLPPREVARIGREVAQALAFAHGQGVLHRDLKPANILLDRTGQPRLTQSGELLGTPAYMAPEQARGEEVDARADLYALGATLYELCAGAPPFTADSVMGVMSKVLRDEPPPLRSVAPEVPAPLAAIIHCCLEKQAADRYAEAEALAADLDAFLGGRTPAAARRRGGAQARKRRRVAGVLLLVAAVGGAVAGTAWWGAARGSSDAGAVQHAERARTTAELRQAQAGVYHRLMLATLDPIATLEDRWFGVPVSDDASAAAVAAVDAAAAAVAGDIPTQSPAGWRGLARFYAGHDDGLERLRAAAAAADGDLFPAALLARAHLAQYVAALSMPAVSYGATGAVVEPFAEGEAMAEHRRAAAAACAQALAGEALAADAPGREALQLTRAAAALGDARHADAAALLEGLHEDPGLGCVADHLRALAWMMDGRHADAAALWRVAGRRGWADPMRCAAQAYLAAGATEGQDGADPRDTYRAAVEAATACLERYPEHTGALRSRGIAHRLLGFETRRRGEDGQPALRAAIADYDAAVGAGDGTSTTYTNRANARLELARLQLARGEDPYETLADAWRDCTGVLKADPTFVRAAVSLAAVCQELAQHERRRGKPASPWLQEGWNWLEKTRSEGAVTPGLQVMRASILSNLGWARFSEGHRPGRDDMERSLALYDALLKEQPRHAEAWRNRAGTVARVALAYAADGTARPDLWRRSIADFDQSIAIDPADRPARGSRAASRYELVLLQQAAGENPEPELQRIEAEMTQALERWPGHPELLFHRARVHQSRIRTAWNTPGGPVPHIEAAVRDLTALLERQPKHAKALFDRGTVHQALGTWTRNQGGDWTPHTLQAALDFNQSARADPRNWMPFAAGGAALEEIGRFEEALAAYEAALKRNPEERVTRNRVARLKAKLGK